jgi:hypothetical protein
VLTLDSTLHQGRVVSLQCYALVTSSSTCPSAREVYSCALIVIVLRMALAAPESLISILYVPRCFTLFRSSSSSKKDICSGETTIEAPLEVSASTAFRLTAISAVETEPYILVFACAVCSTPSCFPSAAAADIADDVGIEGDILFAFSSLEGSVPIGVL